MKLTKRIVLILIVIGGVGLCWLIARELTDRRERAAAAAVVHELGGRMGSLGYWPGGEEIRVEFHDRHFTQEDFHRLVVLNPLTDRHWVGVMFKDTNLTRQDVLRVREMLPDCFVFRVVDGEPQDDSPGVRP